MADKIGKSGDADRLLSRRPLKNLKPSNSKKKEANDV